MADIANRLAGLNPFKPNYDDDDDKGDIIAPEPGHLTRKSDHSKAQLRVSHALRSFLADHNVLSERDAGLDAEEATPALRNLLGQRNFEAPPALIDPSHPLPEYFVSSSHNTYLLANQLYGQSSVSAYETALTTGSRCVEIDAWDNADNEDEPKVTHGFTLVSHIPFRSVCETIRQVFDKEQAAGTFTAGQAGDPASPILLSLENHCGPRGQLRLVQIMREVFGHRLISEPVRRKGTREQQGSGEHVTLEDLGPKISVIVEFHLPDEATDSSDSSDDSSSDEEQRQARQAYKAEKQAASSTTIVPELAELGVYAQSVKPKDNSWYDPGQLINGPHHHLINVSESGLSSHLPQHAIPISRHNSRHLMRVFPKGTRISSSNLHPVKFWGIGAQICALNWQTFSTSNQLNDALFNGSGGYVLKPTALRANGSGDLRTGRMRRLRVHVAGATDVPLHEDRERDSIKPYLTCTLYSPLDADKEPPKRKTSPYKHHKLGFLHRGENPHATDPVWDETLEWEYEDNELVFLRMLIKSDDSFARNPKFAAVAVRLSYTSPGWSFIRMMDLKGKETDCTLLVKFEFEDL
ncbi:1-phosphatidylinositol-4,5-bisphosphate phosphodiesterase gamma 2 [Trichoderma arundinaceum]|uniref:Phosphoinositide phospholipase C n=1 Tax=Trichoderma arundinaceum TaxID=490622 RepID=A0A395NKK8_TRIAR|nr:1-phosphatidylinositol-4,5-bisphosphate phosphodiesterase gamma 2 [Trichoderma arundinaceum]